MRPINLMPCACAILVLMGIQPAAADAGFDRMTDDFVLDFLALSPSSATQFGYHDHHGTSLDDQLDEVP